MARYRKTNEQVIKDKKRRDDIREILNYIKYHADVMDLPPEIRELVRDRLQTSHKIQKSEQTILREKWDRYVYDQCHALLASLSGSGYTPVCDIVTDLPFEMTPQQFGQRVFKEGPDRVTDFIYQGRVFQVERKEKRITKPVPFEDRVLYIPCTKVYYQVT